MAYPFRAGYWQYDIGTMFYESVVESLGYICVETGLPYDGEEMYSDIIHTATWIGDENPFSPWLDLPNPAFVSGEKGFKNSLPRLPEEPNHRDSQIPAYGYSYFDSTSEPAGAPVAVIALDLLAEAPMGDEEMVVYSLNPTNSGQTFLVNPLNETNPGVMVEANAEPESLLRILLTFERPNDIPGLLSLKVSGNSKAIRVWRDAERTMPFPLPFSQTQADLTLAVNRPPENPAFAGGRLRLCIGMDLDLNTEGLATCADLPEALYVEGLDLSATERDICLEMSYEGLGHEFTFTDKVALTVKGFNLQMDENNDGRLAATDDAVEDDALAAGKALGSTDADTDHDGIPDYACFGSETATAMPAAGEDRGRFAFLRFKVPPDVDPATATINLAYNASDPAAVAPDANGILQPADGALRVWNRAFPQARNPAAITAGGNYLPPNTAIPLSALVRDDGGPSTVRQYTLHVEGLCLGKHLVHATLDPTGKGEKLYSDTVQLTVVKLEFVAPGPDGSPVTSDLTGVSAPIPEVTIAPVSIPPTASYRSFVWLTLSGTVRDAVASSMPPAAGADIRSVTAFVDEKEGGTTVCEILADTRPPTFWEPHPYAASFQNLRVRVPVTEGIHVIRVQTSPNAAGNVGCASVEVCVAGKKLPASVADLAAQENASPGESATFALYLPEPLHAGQTDVAYFFRGERNLVSVRTDPEAMLVESSTAATPVVFQGAVGGLPVTFTITALWQPDPGAPDSRVFVPPLSGDLGYSDSQTAVFSTSRVDRFKARISYRFPAGTSLDLGDLTFVETGKDTRLFQARPAWLMRRMAGAALEGFPDPDGAEPPPQPTLATLAVQPGYGSGSGATSPVSVRVRGFVTPPAEFRVNLHGRMYELETREDGFAYLKGGSPCSLFVLQPQTSSPGRFQMLSYNPANRTLDRWDLNGPVFQADLTSAQTPLSAILSVVQQSATARLTPDYDRNRVIDDNDTAAAARRTFYFWINDDEDSAKAYEGDVANGFIGDMPGALKGFWAEWDGRNPNFADDKVNGRSDMLDFFPVMIDLSSLLARLPPEKWTDLEVRLKHPHNAVNAVYTDLSPTTAGDFHITPMTSGFGPSLGNPPHTALVERMRDGELRLNATFLDHLAHHGGKGILLLEGTAKTTEPVTLEVIYGNSRITATLPLHLDGVEAMYRWVNVRDAGGGQVLSPSRTASPAGLPDAVTNNRNFVFIHGYNVGEIESRAWFAEVFKRLYQSGSNAKFTALTWYGNQSQAPEWMNIPDLEIERQNGDDLHILVGAGIGGSSLDYHENACLAFKAAGEVATACNALPGQKIIAAHSLGNMIASSAIADHRLRMEKFFLIDAAVPVEAYDDGAAKVNSFSMDAPWRYMRPAGWKDYDDKTYLWASEWYQRFPPYDGRSTLTWRGRFATIPKAKMVNYYSSGEEVLDNWNHLYDDPPMGRPFAWCTQERVKGTLTAFGSSLASIIFSGKLGSVMEGGWGFNDFYYTPTLNEQGIPGIRHLVPGKNQARNIPFFTPFEPCGGLNVNRPGAAGSRAAKDPDYRARLLADGIPALSYAAGKNPITGLKGNNFDLNIKVKGVDKLKFWPPSVDDNQFKAYDSNEYNNKNRWLHNDLRMVSFYQNYLFYKDMMEKGRLK